MLPSSLLAQRVIAHAPRFCSSIASTTNSDILPIINNRNPRNLERMRLARKPVGYYFDKKNVEYWHKLDVQQANRYVTASLIHNNDSIVVTASTAEWSLRKFLYSATDRAAYHLLARVFAERCLETGLNTCFSEIVPVEGSKMQLFLDTLQEEGMDMEEATVYDPSLIWHKVPEKKPWLVQAE